MPETNHNDPRDDLNTFAQATVRYLDGQLPTDDFIELEKEIRANDAKCELFVRICYQSRLVHESLGDRLLEDFPDDTGINTSLLMEVLDIEQAAADRRSLERVEAEAETQRLAKEESRHRSMMRLINESEPVTLVKRIVIPKAVFYGMIASIAAMLLLLILPMFESKPVVTAPTNEPVAPAPQLMQVATLVEQIDAKWLAPGNSPSPGDALLNQRIHLTSGLAKIRFNNEAEVILEAPCSIKPVSASEIEITHGKLVGRCGTTESKGFVVQTPGARIVDMGTEFGVSVDRQGVSDAHVFEGAIELAANGLRSPVKLHRNEARRVDVMGVSVSAAQTSELDFIRGEEFEANARADESPYHRWLAHSYQLRRDPTTVAYFAFNVQDQQEGVLRNRAMRTTGRFNGLLDKQSSRVNVPQWTQQGRFGKNALQFDRERYERVFVPDWPQAGRFDNMTVAAWVKFERDDGWHLIATQWNDEARPGDRHAFHLGLRCPDYVADDGVAPYRKPGLQLHLSGRRGEMVRDFVSQRNTSSSTSSRDGWVHVAFVFDSVNRRVDLYRNGVRVDSSRFSPTLSKTIPRVSQPLVLGGKAIDEEFTGFEGSMDELVVLKRVMRSDEIRQMYEAGKP